MEKRRMKQALEYAIQIARGLTSLHDTLGLVHQDLKPGVDAIHVISTHSLVV
jgi:hypothetical protein